MSFLGVNIWPHTWNVKIAFYFMLFAFIYFQFNRVCKSYVMRGNGFFILFVLFMYFVVSLSWVGCEYLVGACLSGETIDPK